MKKEKAKTCQSESHVLQAYVKLFQLFLSTHMQSLYVRQADMQKLVLKSTPPSS